MYVLDVAVQASAVIYDARTDSHTPRRHAKAATTECPHPLRSTLGHARRAPTWSPFLPPCIRLDSP